MTSFYFTLRVPTTSYDLSTIAKTWITKLNDASLNTTFARLLLTEAPMATLWNWIKEQITSRDHELTLCEVCLAPMRCTRFRCNSHRSGERSIRRRSPTHTRDFRRCTKTPRTGQWCSWRWFPCNLRGIGLPHMKRQNSCCYAITAQLLVPWSSEQKKKKTPSQKDTFVGAWRHLAGVDDSADDGFLAISEALRKLGYRTWNDISCYDITAQLQVPSK